MTIQDKFNNIEDKLNEIKGLISNVAKDVIQQYNIAEDEADKAENTDDEDIMQQYSMACYRVKERLNAFENEVNSALYYLELAQEEQHNIDNNNF